MTFPRTGIEGKLLAFIEDAGQSVNNEAWFNFDRLLFETDSAVLRPESREQLRNMRNPEGLPERAGQSWRLHRQLRRSLN
jgi:hypothetical protein